MCTLSGEQIARKGFVKAMHEAGMRAVRINTAHLSGTEELATLAAAVKATSRDIKVLIDTKGPEMRTTSTPGDTEIILHEGTPISIIGRDANDTTTENQIVVNYPDLHTVAEAGDKLMIDDGRIELTVEDMAGDMIMTRVMRGGALGSRKGISIVGKEPSLPAVGAHDLDYILMAAASDDIDVIAHSFVRDAEDVAAVEKAMGGKAKPVIAKIENRQGIENLEEITAVADGILIARGDLSATIGAASIAAAQATIADVAMSKGLPLYLATRILPSMMDSKEASEEDVREIYKALEQGVGTMLLTNETASGQYPVECVSVLSEAIRKWEADGNKHLSSLGR